MLRLRRYDIIVPRLMRHVTYAVLVDTTPCLLLQSAGIDALFSDVCFAHECDMARARDGGIQYQEICRAFMAAAQWYQQQVARASTGEAVTPEKDNSEYRDGNMGEEEMKTHIT